MKKFLQENPTIAFGLGLPLLLVVIFLMVSGLPQLLVAKPQYELLYATGAYNYPNVLQITVVEQKVQVIYQGSAYGSERTRLWRYNPRTGGVQEIAIILPPSPVPSANRSDAASQTPTTTVIDVPDLVGLTIDSSSVAPDGYEFRVADNRYSHNIFGGLFYSRRYKREAVLTKSGRSIRLPNLNDRYYNRDTQFVGWILPQ
ncbi:MAG TPA: hypothetical protein PKH39_14380 [Woeseiaceae bacterium]|nr:hypothetical protein [Woeseiaceae bacterium]